MAKKNKKGLGALVTFVLLVAFTIALTSAVFIYEKEKVKELVESSINFGSASIECNDVAINYFECTNPNPVCHVPIKNTGRISIDALVFRDMSGGKVEYGIQTGDSAFFPMKPRDWVEPCIECRGKGNIDTEKSNGKKIEVVPVISISGKFYACDQKVIVLDNSNPGQICGYCNPQ